MSDKSKIDINQISVDNCLTCKLDDCISTDLELCPLMKREIRKKREAYDTERLASENRILSEISGILGDGLTMKEIEAKTRCTYSYLTSLLRRDKLKGERMKAKGKIKVVIIGVNL